MTKILICSWCEGERFLPISSKLVRCQTCDNIKSIDINEDITGVLPLED